MFEQPRNGTLFLGGQKISGSDIRDQNGAHTQLFGFSDVAEA
jgi:T-complex protein 1 subunit alpha